MKRLLLIIIISILLVTPSFAVSTEDMFSACKELTTNIKTSGDAAFMPNTSAVGKCWGAFLVIQYLINTSIDDTLIIHACVPAEVKPSQLVHIFVKYAENNPQFLHDQFFLTAVNSIQDAFPCKKTNLKDFKKKWKR